MTELNWGGKRCPVCEANEVVVAKKCNKCRAKEYYQKNKAKIKKQASKWSKANPEKTKQYSQNQTERRRQKRIRDKEAQDLVNKQIMTNYNIGQIDSAPYPFKQFGIEINKELEIITKQEKVKILSRRHQFNLLLAIIWSLITSPFKRSK